MIFHETKKIQKNNLYEDIRNASIQNGSFDWKTRNEISFTTLIFFNTLHTHIHKIDVLLFTTGRNRKVVIPCKLETRQTQYCRWHVHVCAS